eukprot:scaffold7331_cov403-Prasinococcus_capsulatus_cf.AAC.7
MPVCKASLIVISERNPHVYTCVKSPIRSIRDEGMFEAARGLGAHLEGVVKKYSLAWVYQYCLTVGSCEQLAVEAIAVFHT